MRAPFPKAILMTLDDVMAMYQQTGLYRELQKVITDLLDLIEAQFSGHVMEYFKMEYGSTAWEIFLNFHSMVSQDKPHWKTHRKIS
jgi:hypothetical protein